MNGKIDTLTLGEMGGDIDGVSIENRKVRVLPPSATYFTENFHILVKIGKKFVYSLKSKRVWIGVL